MKSTDDNADLKAPLFDPEVERLLLAAAEHKTRHIKAVFDLLTVHRTPIEIARRNNIGHRMIAQIMNKKEAAHGFKVSRDAVREFCIRVLDEPGKSTRRSRAKKRRRSSAKGK